MSCNTKNKYHIHMSGTVVWLIFFSTLFYKLGFMIIIYLSLFIHELSHIVMIGITHTQIYGADIYPYGINIKLKNIPTPVKRIAISLAGPAASFFVSVMFGIFYVKWGVYTFKVVSSVNFLFFAVNMFPALPLDGGEVLCACICFFKGLMDSVNRTQKISRYVLFAAFLLGVAVAFKSRINTSYITLCAVSYVNLTQLSKHKINTAAYILNGTFQSRRTRRRYMNFNENLPAFSIIPHISTEYTLIVMLYSNDGKFVNCLEQKEILRKILCCRECVLMNEIV